MLRIVSGLLQSPFWIAVENWHKLIAGACFSFRSRQWCQQSLPGL